MTTAEPAASSANDLPPYDPERILNAPFPERMRLICRTWAAQINPNQPIVLAMYWAKYVFVYIGVWAFWNSFNAGYPGFTSPLEWGFSWIAFQKAVIWSIFYELCGIGCSWGPMNARFKPMTLGIRYYARPGTTKLPLFPGVPLIGNYTRSFLDVGLYAASQLYILYCLMQPELTGELLLPIFIAIPLLGILDKTLFLCARAEHYWVALSCLVFAAGDGLWISGCKIVWCFIWFWAATSKLNNHFPSVIMVMMNNGPFFPKALKKRLFKSYPDDLRPSKFAATMAHFGTTTEYMIPVLLLASPSPTFTAVVLCLMFSFHGFIALNNPAGMPIEWNILMVYGGIFLFGFNPEHGITAMGQEPLLLAFLLFNLAALPAFGNFVPSRLSFLLSMRYYAGNWPYNAWLFKKGATEKLAALKTSCGTMRQQLESMDLPADQVEMGVAMSYSARFLHLQGRPLQHALPRAVDDIDEYEWVEGELLGGSIIGWNFGDGHLNNHNLLEAITSQVDFEEGELRVISVESQPLFGPTMHWVIRDAKTGIIDEGTTHIGEMSAETPYPTGEYAEAILRGRSGNRG